MPKTCYTAHAKKNGRKVATLHFTHDNLPAAKKDAAALAGMIPGAKGLVEVKRNPAKARRNPDDFARLAAALKAREARYGVTSPPPPKPASRDYAAERLADAEYRAWERAERERETKRRAEEDAAEAESREWIRRANEKNEEARKKHPDRRPVGDSESVLGWSAYPWWGGNRRNPANPPREIVLGHVVIHTKAGYTIPAYKRTFSAMKDVRKWLKEHVKRETSATPNPRCRCKK